ncbi:MAG: hypothetical protein ABFC78_04570 [Methanoregula sp.]
MSPELCPPKLPLSEGIESIIKETVEDPKKKLTITQFRSGLSGKYTDDQICSILTYFAQKGYIKIEKKIVPPDNLFEKDDSFYITANGITAYHTWRRLDKEQMSFL